MMLISQTLCESECEQGCSATDFAQLRRQLGEPASIEQRDRQRLVKLAQRLARVRAMGDEYLRVDFSDQAAAVLHAADA